MSLSCPHPPLHLPSPQASKLERLPEYFRDTMDWITGRTRRKGEGKDAVAESLLGSSASSSTVDSSKRRAASSRIGTSNADAQRRRASVGGGGPRKSLSSELSVCETLTDLDLNNLVVLPPLIDHNEWIASHLLSFFHHSNALYGSILEYCTPESCPNMSGPGQMQFTWVDEKGKKCKYPAGQYIDSVMSYIQIAAQSQEHFPTKYGNNFSPSFDGCVRKVVRLIGHVLLHLYHAHFPQLCAVGLRAQAGAVFAHFSVFCTQFSLLDTKDSAMLAEIVRLSRPSIPTSLDTSPEEEEHAASSDRLPQGTHMNWSGGSSGAPINYGLPCAQTA